MDADVYRICLTDGASFSASTVGGTFPPNLDTQLFLLDAQGYGIYANDDAVAGVRASTLPAQHRFSPTTGGEYFLAVSQYNRDPQSSQGEIFQDNFSRMQFPDGVIFANGFGAAETLSGWNGRAPGGLGTYRITLTGTRACVPPDTTPPTVDLRSPVDGSHVAQGAEVVVDFSCADEGGSGLDSCVGSTPDGGKLDTSKLGPVTVTVTARDKAGNQTVATSTVTVEDRTDPTVTLTTPADGAVYERDEDVAADYGCADEANGSGLDSCVGDVPNGADVDTTTLGEHSFTVTATDKAGNHASAVAHYTVVDVTAPQIALTTPSQGAVYDLGQQVTASYSCADEDGGSGLAVVHRHRGERRHGGHLERRREELHRERDRQRGQPRLHDRDLLGRGPGGARDHAERAHRRRGVRARRPRARGLLVCGPARWLRRGVVHGNGGERQADRHVELRQPHLRGAGHRRRRQRGRPKTVTYSVAYDFDGFFWPVKNLPNVTRWKAGLPVPVRFSLHGFRGARPEADGYPRSMRCGGGDVGAGGARGPGQEEGRVRVRPALRQVRDALEARTRSGPAAAVSSC